MIPFKYWPIQVVAGVFFGVVFYGFYYAKGISYLSDDPSSCINCHIMQDQYRSWSRSIHGPVTNCNDCHLPHHPIMKYVKKAENGFLHSYYFTFQNFKEPIQIHQRNLVNVEKNCLSCHQTIMEMVNRPSQTKGKDAPSGHDGSHGGSQNCVACHRDVAHKR